MFKLEHALLVVMRTETKKVIVEVEDPRGANLPWRPAKVVIAEGYFDNEAGGWVLERAVGVVTRNEDAKKFFPTVDDILEFFLPAAGYPIK